MTIAAPAPSDFYEGLSNAITLRALGESAFQLRAFGDELAQRLEDAEVAFDITVEPLQCTGRNRKSLRLLGYAEDPADDSLVVLAYSYFGERGRTLTRKDAMTAFDSASSFLEQSADGWLLDNLEISSREAAHAQYFRMQLERAQKIKFILVTDGVMTGSLRTIESSVVCGLPASYAIWDLRRFEDLELSESGLDEFTVDFTKWVPEGLACLPGAESDRHAKSYLLILPGQLLADVYAEYGSQLLESNVRTFLSTRGKVNKGIQVTLANEPEMFLAYNNGLTTTATSVDIVTDGGVPRIRRLDNWQIVNGGQTTASMAYFLKQASGRSLDGVYVATKLVTVDADVAPELVGQISRYANSQNSVSEADLFSNSPFHVRLEQISRRMMAPAREGEQYQTKWYYERARGQYENQRSALTASGQKKFDLEFPKSQRLTKTDWAKYAFSWSQRPHEVSRGAQSNFMAFAKLASDTWAKSPDAVNDAYYRNGVAKAIMFAELRTAVMTSDWYDTGYLANIVTYGVSKFAHEVERQFGGRKFDFERVWAHQGLSPATLEGLLRCAHAARDLLTAENRPQANVTQWAKQQACWEGAKRASVRLPLELESDLLDGAEALARAASAKRERKIDSGLEAQTRVLHVRPEVWARIKREGVRTGVLSPTDLDLIVLVERGGLPTDRQAGRLMAVLDKAVQATLISPDDL